MQEEQLSPIESPEAERAVLGACILSRDALGTAVEMLRADDFYDFNNKLAWEVMVEMYSSEMPVDFVTFSEALKNKNLFERVGGQPFIASIIANIKSTANVDYYAEIVRETSLRRRLVEAGYQIINLAHNRELESQRIIEKAEELIFEAARMKKSSDFTALRDLIAPAFKKIEDAYNSTGSSVTGFPSGFQDLDNLITGFQPGSLNILAARPSMGKTALALNIAQFGGGIGNNPYILIFSLEMSAEQLVRRMFAAEAQVNMASMNNGTFGVEDWDKLNSAAKFLSGRNIYINDDSDLSVMDFRTRCRRFKNRHPELALIIVDYLQLMSTGDRRPDSRQQEVSEISRLLKIVAREVECPVIALSQLSREAEKRTEKKPQLSDLRDSGAIEQDADIVMLLYREDYYTEKNPKPDQNSKAELRVAKNRNGSTGTCVLTFMREYTLFRSNIEDEDF